MTQYHSVLFSIKNDRSVLLMDISVSHHVIFYIAYSTYSTLPGFTRRRDE